MPFSDSRAGDWACSLPLLPLLLVVVVVVVVLLLLLLLLLHVARLSSSLQLLVLLIRFVVTFGRSARPARWLSGAGTKQARRADAAVPRVQVSEQTPRRLKRFGSAQGANRGKEGASI